MAAVGGALMTLALIGSFASLVVRYRGGRPGGAAAAQVGRPGRARHRGPGSGVLRVLGRLAVRPGADPGGSDHRRAVPGCCGPAVPALRCRPDRQPHGRVPRFVGPARRRLRRYRDRAGRGARRPVVLDRGRRHADRGGGVPAAAPAACRTSWTAEFARERYSASVRIDAFLDRLRAGTEQPERVEDLLRDVLHDPTLRVLLLLPASHQYSDLRGNLAVIDPARPTVRLDRGGSADVIVEYARTDDPAHVSRGPCRRRTQPARHRDRPARR